VQTERQILFKIQLPLANQLFWPELISDIIGLSMVVIASW
jgi:ABC-type proline/glycine betaine transport system permease subunit